MATINVTSTGVQIVVGSGAGGGLNPLSPNPAGTFALATVTVDAYGRVTAATTTGNVATETTLQMILGDMDYIQTQVDGTGVTGGAWNPIPP